MLLLQAIVLGLLQGTTELLPVSSSGHLQGVPYLLGWRSGSPAFEVMVRAGTLVAVIAYFREDLWYLATRSLGIGVMPDGEARRARFVVGLLAIGTVPAATAGYLFEDVLATAFESPRVVAGFLFGTAALLVVAEGSRRRRAARQLGVAPADLRGPDRHLDPGRREDAIRPRQALVIGLAQALAIVPGLSRTGTTIAAGMILGFSRGAAARFSFLLSIPVILGTTVGQLPELGEVAPDTLPFGGVEIAVGGLAAAIGGWWAIRFLLQLVQTDDLLGFARYVAGFATLLFAATFWIG